jgi:hypothetical protein
MLKFVGMLVPLFPLWPFTAICAAILFYVRHRKRVEPERRVSPIAYALAVIVCGGAAGCLGVIAGIQWGCSIPNAGNLCGLIGFLVVGPFCGTLAVFLVGFALSLIPPAG